jgi:hypothetical protein
MKVRTVLFPIDSGSDVLVMQYQSEDNVSWTTIPLISSSDLSLSEIKELAQSLADNEAIGRNYVANRQAIFDQMNQTRPDVLEAVASDVSSPNVEESSSSDEPKANLEVSGEAN